MHSRSMSLHYLDLDNSGQSFGVFVVGRPLVSLPNAEKRRIVGRRQEHDVGGADDKGTVADGAPKICAG